MLSTPLRPLFSPPEFAEHERIVQDASSDSFTGENCFGMHDSAKAIMEQLDELCVEEVGMPNLAMPIPSKSP